MAKNDKFLICDCFGPNNDTIVEFGPVYVIAHAQRRVYWGIQKDQKPIKNDRYLLTVTDQEFSTVSQFMQSFRLVTDPTAGTIRAVLSSWLLVLTVLLGVEFVVAVAARQAAEEDLAAAAFRPRQLPALRQSASLEFSPLVRHWEVLAVRPGAW